MESLVQFMFTTGQYLLIYICIAVVSICYVFITSQTARDEFMLCTRKSLHLSLAVLLWFTFVWYYRDKP